MQLRYDSEVDVLFLRLRHAEGGERGGKRLDEKRIAHFDHAGNIVAYEFLFASDGVSLDGIDADDGACIREAVERVARLAPFLTAAQPAETGAVSP